MRILVNNIAASTGGALTVLNEFYDCVKKHDYENEWIFLLGSDLLPGNDRIKIISLPDVKHSHIKRLLFDLFSGRKLISALKPDVVFSMQNTIAFGLDVPQILYIQQAIPFQNIKNFSFLKKDERSLAVNQHLIGSIIKMSARKANKVIVQTKWMKDAVCKQCKVADKVHVVCPKLQNVSNAENDIVFDHTSFFYPSAESVYKNNQLIYEAAKILDEKGFDFNICLTLPQEHSVHRVNCIGTLPYSQVLEAYKKSVLVFPSFIESFGYPLAEARAAGALILASDCPFSHEVLDGYKNVRFFHPFNKYELADLMAKVIQGEITRSPIKESEEKYTNPWLDVLKIITSN